MAVYESVIDLIGNTPMVDASALSPNPNVRIYTKLEGQNPGGSVKDRAAKFMILDAERKGLLTPGATVLESSSGNTGIALAMICKMRGYTFKVVLPENVSVERRQALEVWGAEIIPSPASEGSNGAMVRAQKLAAEHPEWWFPFQYGNDANPRAHYEGTGPEILADAPDITHFVAGLGTAGTLMGVGTYLKEHKPDTQVWAIEPPAGEMVENPVYKAWASHRSGHSTGKNPSPSTTSSTIMNGSSATRPRPTPRRSCSRGSPKPISTSISIATSCGKWARSACSARPSLTNIAAPASAMSATG